MKVAGIDEAIEAMAKGGFVLVVDDEDRENEGDLILAAERVTPEKIAFMVRHTSGLICLPIDGRRLDELRLPLMVLENTDTHKTAFTISVDYTKGTTTGISAADRAATVLAVVDPDTQPEDLARPGHVFPLRYREGGVIVRPGHTEAAVDLARLAGLSPAGVLCEIVNDDGTMTRGDALWAFAERHDIPLITIADLVDYRWRTEALVVREAHARIPTDFGAFTVYGYRAPSLGTEHVALVKGDVAGKSQVLTRVHSVCLTGDVFASRRCDCGAQLRTALDEISRAGEGVVVYNPAHEGRGIGLVAKLGAYELQDQGLDTVEANVELGRKPDERHYGVDAQILMDLKVSSVRLMTNNPTKVDQLQRFGIDVAARVPLWVGRNGDNERYLSTKAEKLGHFSEELP